MLRKIKIAPVFLICLILSVSLSFPIDAASEKSYNTVDGVLCIAYRGDTAEYEANSPEAVVSAFEKGADFVSVNVRKNKDNTLVLCGENETEVKGIALKEMLKKLADSERLILDFDKEIKEEVYQLIKDENALSKAILRIHDSEKNINDWISSKDDEPAVIGVCSGFNVFTIRSFMRKLSHLPAVQYQSKNYFNVMYDSVCYSTYGSRQGTRAIAPMYNPDLCGQRSDSENGWNDLIKKNFSIIETNNLDAFIKYRDNIVSLKLSLKALCEKAEKINTEGYSLVSRENLERDIQSAKTLSEPCIVSCDELQEAYSSLLLSINSLTPSQGEDTQKGALNITAGKIIAAVLVGGLVFAAQVFTHKMQREKKR